MITGFGHKGLKALYETGSSKKIRTDLVGRVRVVLAILDEAQSLDDLTRPSLRLHALSGNRKVTGLKASMPNGELRSLKRRVNSGT